MRRAWVRRRIRGGDAAAATTRRTAPGPRGGDTEASTLDDAPFGVVHMTGRPAAAPAF
jgi:hypothetical protein